MSLPVCEARICCLLPAAADARAQLSLARGRRASRQMIGEAEEFATRAQELSATLMASTSALVDVRTHHYL